MQPVLLLRGLARVWSIASTLLLLAFLFGGRENLFPTASQAVSMLFFPVGILVGFLVAWRWELLGGLGTVGSLVLFYVWTFILSGRIPMTPYFVLFAAPGFLFLACSLWSEKSGEAVV